MDDVRLDDPRHQRVLEWVTSAPSEREPRTQLGLAESLGVSARTVRDWMDRDDFKRAWKARVDQVAGSPERTQAILDQLYADATDPQSRSRVQSAKLYFEVTKAISPPEVNVNVTSRRAQDLSDEELEALISAGAVEVLGQRGHLRRVA